MDLADAYFWSSLHILTKQRYEALQEVFGDLGSARKYLSADMLKGMGCREETVRDVLDRKDDFNPDAYTRKLQKHGITFLTIDNETYPAKLRTLPDPPVFLYTRGDITVLQQPCISMVGTRAMSPYGKRVTQLFTERFVEAGMVTVSGLATGIDGEVAEETLRRGGKTVAVLGTGFPSIYPPSHTKLAESIVKAGGLLLTEFPLGYSGGQFTFPARNRIIAALGLGTIVLEAPEGSGALQTAEHALDLGLEVFAVPGQILDENYTGCNTLISSGQAHLALHPDDVLQTLKIIAPAANRSSYAPQNPDEELLMRLLTTLPQPADDLVLKAKLPAGRVGATLTMLELSGAARNIGNGQWVKA